MSTRGCFLLSIAALLAMLVVTSVPATGQGVGSRATRLASAGWTVRFADRPGGGAAAAQGGRGQGGRGGGAAFPAGPIPRRADGKPDLTGHWNGSGGALTHTALLEEHPGGFGILAGKSLIIDPPDGIIPYQPSALAERNRRRDDANGYEDEVAHCEFYSVPRLHSFAQDILYSGNNIVINAFRTMTRVIPLDRREHLPEGIRLWLGDPIGRWDGDTLVVDSTNFNDRTRMALGGDFYGAEAHIVERFTMVDANTINWTMTFTNPKVFTRPWTMTSAAPMARVRAQGDDIFDAEDTCHEGNVDLIHLKNVYDQAHGTGSQAK
jgi:hypothetical protein